MDSTPTQTHGACYHTPATTDYPHGRVLSRNDIKPEETRKMQKEARAKSNMPSEKVGYPANETRYAVVQIQNSTALIQIQANLKS